MTSPPSPKSSHLLSQLALAVTLFLGGAAMTAAWMALFFRSPDLPDVRQAPPDPLPAAAPAKRRLLWLVFDAMRPDAAFDAGLMPHLARLRARGTWGVARTGPFTMTGTCIRSLGTGMLPSPTDIINNFSAPPHRGDSLFRRLHHAGRRVAHFGEKIWRDRFGRYFAVSFPQPDLGITDVDKTDRATMTNVSRHLAKGWDIALVHFVGSDHAAHKERSIRGAYRRKLASYDRLIPRLRQLMGPEATVLVQADHGCTDRGHHGAGGTEAMRAPYVLAGPGVARRGRLDIDQRALTPLLAALLGVPAPWGAQVPAALDALDAGPIRKATWALNLAAQRNARLAALRVPEAGSTAPVLRRALAHYEAGRYREARRDADRAVRAVTAREQRLGAAGGGVWLAAGSLFLTLPLLLLLVPGTRRWGWSAGLVALGVAGVVALLVLEARVGAILGASILGVAAGLWFAQSDDRTRRVWGGALGAAAFLIVLGGGWLLQVALGAARGGNIEINPLAASALLVGLPVVWQGGRRVVEHPIVIVLLVAAALFLPLPAVRWWSGRHHLFRVLGIALALGGVLYLYRRKWADARVVAGGLLLALLFSSPYWLPAAVKGWAVREVLLVAVPGGLALLARATERAWLPAALAVGAWLLAHLGAQLEPTVLLAGFGALVVALALFVPGTRPLHAALVVLAAGRLLLGDVHVAALSAFGLGVLGLARTELRFTSRWSAVLLAVLASLLELVVFYHLGREFSFDSIDVRPGFVGGGDLDLVRVTVLIAVGYSLPWWLLWCALADVRAPLSETHTACLAILATKLLGTFLLFLLRPAHFWMLQSLVPFQFFALAQLPMVLLGYLLAAALRRGPLLGQR